jgi:uncharacterized protein (DUF952 family)
MSAAFIFHVCPAKAWEAAIVSGAYHGSADDTRDGYLHFSGGDQVRESVAKHRAGQTGLVMLAVDPDILGDALKWEVSRSGTLFPHLYGPLPVDAVTQVTPLPLGDDGMHVFPPEIP